jgi:hypothetical protein
MYFSLAHCCGVGWIGLVGRGNKSESFPKKGKLLSHIVYYSMQSVNVSTAGGGGRGIFAVLNKWL